MHILEGAEMTVRSGALVLFIVVALSVSSRAPDAQPLPDALRADSTTYSIEFENDLVRVLRVRLAAGHDVARHAHPAYCAIEISDSSLKEPNGPVSQSKAGQVFCGDATAHAPTNVGNTVAESIVVEFKGRQKAR
jgi:hypothetical protein